MGSRYPIGGCPGWPGRSWHSCREDRQPSGAAPVSKETTNTRRCSQREQPNPAHSSHTSIPRKPSPSSNRHMQFNPPPLGVVMFTMLITNGTGHTGAKPHTFQMPSGQQHITLHAPGQEPKHENQPGQSREGHPFMQEAHTFVFFFSPVLTHTQKTTNMSAVIHHHSRKRSTLHSPAEQILRLMRSRPSGAVNTYRALSDFLLMHWCRNR